MPMEITDMDTGMDTMTSMKQTLPTQRLLMSWEQLCGRGSSGEQSKTSVPCSEPAILGSMLIE